ncbi:MAG: BMP family lipoprotein [Candidatus Hodarchaeales archaeon]
MRKLRIVVITTVILLSLFAFSSTSALGKKAADKRVAVVFATGGLGDKSFNDAAFRGLKDAIDTFGSDLEVSFSEPPAIADFPAHQAAFASSGDYDLIICVGFLQWDALNASVVTYPNQRWVIIDSVLNSTMNPSAGHVSSITFKEHEGSYLVGAMAAMTTKTDKIGFLGGLDIYLINKFLAGYQQGAQYIDPNITISAVYSPDPTNPWGDIAGGKSIAQTFFTQDIDVVYSAAGGTGIGVIEAAGETTDKYAIGVDSDQDYLSEGSVLCSMLKKVETAVFDSIEAIMDDTFDSTWADNHVELGLAEGGVGISEMAFTEDIKNGDFTKDGTTKTRWEWIQDITAKINDGTIVVDDEPETPTETGQTAFGFEAWSIVPVLGFAALIVLRKKRKA